jgi:hypothetical protein
MRMTRMATTGNVAWDGRLESFKGTDTTITSRPQLSSPGPAGPAGAN